MVILSIVVNLLLILEHLKDFRCNIQKMMEIGKKGVLALLCESSYSKNDGYTSPNHKLTAKIESIFEECFRTYYYFKLCTKCF